MVSSYIPDRGDIVWLNFSPIKGHEQAGARPALVLSPKTYNSKSDLMLACPITSKVKGYPFEVPIIAGKVNGVVLADQIKSLDWQARKPSFSIQAPLQALEQTQQIVELLVKG